MHRHFIILFLVLVLIAFITTNFALAQSVNHRVILGFCAFGDAQCDQLQNQILLPLLARKSDLEVYLIDVFSPDWPNIKLRLSNNVSITLENLQTPSILLGEEIFRGLAEIQRKIDSLDMNFSSGLTVEMLATIPAIAQYRLSLPEVHIAYFFGPDLEDEKIRQDILKPHTLKYSHLKLHLADISRRENLYLIESLYSQITNASEKIDLPILIAGDKILIGIDKIEASAQAVLATLLLSGAGTQLPTWLTDQSVVWCEEECETTKTVWASYFSDNPHAATDLIDLQLTHLEEKNPQFVVERFEYTLYKDLAHKLAGLTGDTLRLPALFIGNSALYAEEITPTNVQNLINRYQSGAERLWLRFVVLNTHDHDPTGQESPNNILDFILLGLAAGFSPINVGVVVILLFVLKMYRAAPRTSILVGLYLSFGAFITGTLYINGIMPTNLSQGYWLEDISLWASRILTVICAILAIYSMRELIRPKIASNDFFKHTLYQFQTKRNPSRAKAWSMAIFSMMLGSILPILHFYHSHGAINVIASTDSLSFIRPDVSVYLLNLLSVLPILFIAGLGFIVHLPTVVKLQYRLPLIKSSIQALIFAGLAIWMYNLI